MIVFAWGIHTKQTTNKDEWKSLANSFVKICIENWSDFTSKWSRVCRKFEPFSTNVVLLIILYVYLHTRLQEQQHRFRLVQVFGKLLIIWMWNSTNFPCMFFNEFANMSQGLKKGEEMFIMTTCLGEEFITLDIFTPSNFF